MLLMLDKFENDYKTPAASYFAFEVAEEEDQRQEQRQGDDDAFLIYSSPQKI